MIEHYHNDQQDLVAGTAKYGEWMQVPFDGYIHLVEVYASGLGASYCVCEIASGQISVGLRHGGGEYGVMTFIGSIPVKQGVKIRPIWLSEAGGTGYFEFYMSDTPGGGGFIQMTEGSLDQSYTRVTTDTATATAGGAISAELKPIGNGSLFWVNTPVEVQHHDDTGAAGRDVVIHLTDGTWAFEVETKVALAEDTWEKVDFRTVLPDIDFPYCLTKGWYLTATVTAGAAGDTVSVRAPIQHTGRVN